MEKSDRRKFIIGNWKMNKTIAEARSFVDGLAPAARAAKGKIGLAVPFTALFAAAEAAKGTAIAIGAQNVSQAEDGALTGEISCNMIKDAGAVFALVGHSERRRHFHEDDSIVNQKVLRLLGRALQPVVCIGETLAERDGGLMKEVLQKHLTQSLKGLSPEQVASVVVAYEPIWAIGTNRAASPEDVQLTHAYCRSVIGKVWGEETASKIQILYGGSVTAGNAGDLLNQKDVDGLLVGGASLTLESFSDIVRKF